MIKMTTILKSPINVPQYKLTMLLVLMLINQLFFCKNNYPSFTIHTLLPRYDYNL